VKESNDPPNDSSTLTDHFSEISTHQVTAQSMIPRQNDSRGSLQVKEFNHLLNDSYTTADHFSEIITHRVKAKSMISSLPAKNSLPVRRSWPRIKVSYGSCSEQECLWKGSKNSLNARDSFCKSKTFSFNNLTVESIFASVKYRLPGTGTMSSKPTHKYSSFATQA